MSVPLTLLGLLEREPSHGYDLKRDYDTWFGRGKPLPYGQVYATLSRLARDGTAIACAPLTGLARAPVAPKRQATSAARLTPTLGPVLTSAPGTRFCAAYAHSGE